MIEITNFDDYEDLNFNIDSKVNLYRKRKFVMIKHSLEVMKHLKLDTSQIHIYEKENSDNKLIIKCKDKKLKETFMNIMTTVDKRIVFFTDQDLDLELLYGQSLMTH